MSAPRNLVEENYELRRRLSEAEELLTAIRSGLVDAFATDDQKEGMAAFVEKRPAKFQGR